MDTTRPPTIPKTLIPALTLWQPWATLMACDEKRDETRGWPLRVRGPLMIHAAKFWSPELLRLSRSEPFASALARHGYDSYNLPFGAMVCELVVVGCEHVLAVAPRLSAQELAFGDYREVGDDGHRRYAIETAQVKRFAEPIPWRGAQGLWWYDGPRP